MAIHFLYRRRASKGHVRHAVWFDIYEWCEAIPLLLRYGPLGSMTSNLQTRAQLHAHSREECSVTFKKDYTNLTGVTVVMACTNSTVTLEVVSS